MSRIEHRLHRCAWIDTTHCSFKKGLLFVTEIAAHSHHRRGTVSRICSSGLLVLESGRLALWLGRRERLLQ